MFMTTNAKVLRTVLGNFINESEIDEEMLLKAYIHYSIRLAPSFSQSLDDSLLSLPAGNALPDNLSTNFLRYTLAQFIVTVVPNLVGDCQKIAHMIEEGKIIPPDFLKYKTAAEREAAMTSCVCFAILFIKHKFTASMSPKQELQNIDKNWLYSTYATEAKRKKIPFIAELLYFDTLTEHVLLLRQDASLNILDLRSYDNAFNAIRALYDTFGFNKTQVLWFLAEGYALSGKTSEGFAVNGIRNALGIIHS